MCHKPGFETMKHIMPCCDGGYIVIPDPDLTPEQRSDILMHKVSRVPGFNGSGNEPEVVRIKSEMVKPQPKKDIGFFHKIMSIIHWINCNAAFLVLVQAWLCAIVALVSPDSLTSLVISGAWFGLWTPIMHIIVKKCVPEENYIEYYNPALYVLLYIATLIAGVISFFWAAIVLPASNIDTPLERCACVLASSFIMLMLFEFIHDLKKYNLLKR